MKYKGNHLLGESCIYYKDSMPIANSPESLALTDEERLTIRKWVDDGAFVVWPRRQPALNRKPNESNSEGGCSLPFARRVTSPQDGTSECVPTSSRIGFF
jgi:hypothetical protein